jgi:hypothetical protein
VEQDLCWAIASLRRRGSVRPHMPSLSFATDGTAMNAPRHEAAVITCATYRSDRKNRER